MFTRALSLVFGRLDPAESMSAIMYGLIMVLSITLTAGCYVGDSPNPARTLLIAAIGCNVAWGLIDGVMFVVTGMYQRGIRNRLIQDVRNAADEQTAITKIKERIRLAAGELLPEAEVEGISRMVHAAAKGVEVREVRATKDDVLGGMECFALNVLATLPALVPFLLIADWTVALRASNLVTILMMFLVGYRWAKYANANRLKIGMAMAFLGLTLVGIAVLLGG